MEIEIYRRKRGSTGQWKSHEKPLINLQMPRGQITVFKKTMELMGLQHGDAVMFGFNKKEKCGYIFKEEPQEDSYYLRNNQRGYARFTSKDLMLHMCDVFELQDEKNIYFIVDEQPNEKGMYKFTQ